MEQYLSRALKPLIESILVFVAVRYLTGSLATAIGIGLIPLALGWLAIGTALGAAITVTTVVASLCWYAVPADIKSVVRAQTRDAMPETASVESTAPAMSRTAQNESREAEPAAPAAARKTDAAAGGASTSGSPGNGGTQ